jgi:hypothetical protein
MGQTRQFGDAGSMSGLRESGHGYKTARWQRLGEAADRVARLSL